jgi:hypothetical protein
MLMSVNLRKTYRLKVYESRIAMKICGPKRNYFSENERNVTRNSVVRSSPSSAGVLTSGSNPYLVLLME